jgi:CrcB protein
MIMFLAIAFGGALGAVSRYAVSLMITSLYGAGLQPLATLTVNILGSGLMGICYVLLSIGFISSDPMRGVLMVGFLGALTTFSSFALDAITLMEKGQGGLALGYVAASVVLSIAAFMLMVVVSRALLGGQ